MNESNGDDEMFVIDFSKLKDTTLFTGRKNGKRAKIKFNIKNANKYQIIANSQQVITSSYFLGLMGEELNELLSKQSNINELLEKIDIKNLNDVSKNECIRAIRRGLTRSNMLG